MKHVLRSQDFDRERIQSLFSLATQYKKQGCTDYPMRGKIMCSLFYEPSTRTRLSFESAHLKLGGSVMGTDNASEFSSAVKGETLEDSIRVISSYSDLIVLRHRDNDAALRAAEVSNCSIINAGSGTGQHPTQSLLDLYTIQDRLGRVSGLHVAIVGDLKHGRTVRSLAYLLGKYQGVCISFVADPNLQISEDILDYLDRHNVSYQLLQDLSTVVSVADVVYQTRSQKERHSGLFEDCNLTITSELEQKMQSHAIIMHPLPRNDEIATDVDKSHRAVYFEQAANGLWVRMALLSQINFDSMS